MYLRCTFTLYIATNHPNAVMFVCADKAEVTMGNFCSELETSFWLPDLVMGAGLNL
jgi:hypothetical protein